MPITLHGQRLDFLPIATRADIESNPAVVTHVGRNGVARIRREQTLSVHAHPKMQAKTLVVMPRQRKGSLARLPHRTAKLTGLTRLRQPEA